MRYSIDRVYKYCRPGLSKTRIFLSFTRKEMESGQENDHSSFNVAASQLKPVLLDSKLYYKYHEWLLASPSDPLRFSWCFQHFKTPKYLTFINEFHIWPFICNMNLDIHFGLDQGWQNIKTRASSCWYGIIG